MHCTTLTWNKDCDSVGECTHVGRIAGSNSECVLSVGFQPCDRLCGHAGVEQQRRSCSLVEGGSSGIVHCVCIDDTIGV